MWLEISIVVVLALIWYWRIEVFAHSVDQVRNESKHQISKCDELLGVLNTQDAELDICHESPDKCNGTASDVQISSLRFTINTQRVEIQSIKEKLIKLNLTLIETNQALDSAKVLLLVCRSSLARLEETIISQGPRVKA